MQKDTFITCTPDELPKDSLKRFVELICEGGAIPVDPAKIKKRLEHRNCLEQFLTRSLVRDFTALR